MQLINVYNKEITYFLHLSVRHHFEKSNVATDSGSSEGDAFGAIRPEVSCVPFNRNEWKAIKMFLIGVAPLFLIPFPLLFFYIIYHLTCKYFNFFEQCNDLPWLIPYMFFLLLSLHSLVNPITSLWLNKDFQRPSLIRRR